MPPKAAPAKGKVAPAKAAPAKEENKAPAQAEVVPTPSAIASGSATPVQAPTSVRHSGSAKVVKALVARSGSKGFRL